MLDQTSHSITERGWVPRFSSLDLHLSGMAADRRMPVFSEPWGEQPIYVPVMQATVLRLELLLQEPYIDLRLASELVLSDLGATIQILRLTGREFEDADERPTRMEDCIAGLDVEEWFAAISAHAIATDEEDAPAAALWEHSHVIAQYSQLVAESLDGVSAEEAYLVGLLHEISAIPGILGWEPSPVKSSLRVSPVVSSGTSPDTRSAVTLAATSSPVPTSSLAHLLAEVWCLPAYLIEALDSLQESRSPSLWTRILAAAHEIADAGSFGEEADGCGLGDGLEQMIDTAKGIFAAEAPISFLSRLETLGLS